MKKLICSLGALAIVSSGVVSLTNNNHINTTNNQNQDLTKVKTVQKMNNISTKQKNIIQNEDNEKVYLFKVFKPQLINALKDAPQLETKIHNDSGGDFLYQKDMDAISVLQLSNHKIDSNFQNIDLFTNLSSLVLNNTGSLDIFQLWNLRDQLNVLWVTSDTIKNLTDLPHFKKLTMLELDGITAPPEEKLYWIFLQEMPWLQRLAIGYDNIENISALRKLVNLDFLSLENNKVSDLSPLSNLKKLDTLIIGSNQVSDISVLSNLTELNKLYLDSNKISDVSVLKKLTKLEDLKLNNNQISDVSALGNLNQLQYLYLDDNKISDVSALNVLTKLIELSLYRNYIPNTNDAWAPIHNMPNNKSWDRYDVRRSQHV